MDKEMLRELQLAEYKMLKDVTAFCDENQIQYSLVAGTLLGAMRHNGFIPWDDDIDIIMDHKNYKRFIKVSKKEFPKKYFVQNFTTEKKVNYPWTKIRINGTTSIDPRLRNLQIHSGICMDIFVLNGIAEKKIHRKLQLKFARYQRKLMNKYYYRAISPSEKDIYQRIPEVFRIPLIKLFDLIVNINSEKTKYCISNFFNGLNSAILFESKWFEQGEKVRFEGELFSAPKEKEKYLEARYGDWRSLPPEDERKGHGDIIVDLHNDYTMYLGTKC